MISGKAGSAVNHHSVVVPSTATLLKLLLFLLPFAKVWLSVQP